MYIYNYNISSYGYLNCEKMSLSQYFKQVKNQVPKIKVEKKSKKSKKE